MIIRNINVSRAGITDKPETFTPSVHTHTMSDITDLAITKGDVGLGNVDNTTDLDKPISTATQTDLDTKQDTLVSGTNIKTINSTSILGSGDIVISGGGGGGGGFYGLPDAIAGQSALCAYASVIGSTNFTTVANSVYYIPFIISYNLEVTDLGFSFNGNSLTLDCSLGIYSNNAGFPGSRLRHTTLVQYTSTTSPSTRPKRIAITPYTLVAGTIYWLAMGVVQGGVFPVKGIAVTQMVNFIGINIRSGSGVSGYTQALSSGRTELPATANTLSVSISTQPIIFLNPVL